MAGGQDKITFSAPSLIESVLTAGLIGLGGWVFYTNSQVAVMSGEIYTLQAQSEAISKHEVEIQVLKTELRYIREGVDEVSALLRAKDL